MDDAVRRVAYCPHCGNRAPQKLIRRQRYLERTWSGPDGAEIDPTHWSTFIVVCETCGQILLYDNLADETDDAHFDTCELVYPRSARLHISVPRRIAEVYEEASRIREIAPNAFAVQIRRALEALCEDRGVRKGALQTRLRTLTESREIPPVLAEASEVLRLLGNVGAHRSDESVHPLLATAIDDFFRAIVEYVYVAPSKLEDFKSRMAGYIEKKEEDV